MKHAIILLGGILLIGIASCKTKSKVQTTTNTKTSTSNSDAKAVNSSTTQPTVYNQVTDQACAIEVSFGSYASGIDGPALDKVNALIEAKKLKSTSKTIGREGERRICLPLTELKENEKKDFIEQLKKIAKEGQLVSISIR
ncbi:MAG: hypothetical protein WCH21_06160 [Bacteroidota bacterium]